MRIVTSFLDHFKAIRRGDPIFGSMRYMGDRLGYWECKVALGPDSPVIEAFVDGAAEDNMEAQHRFFEQLSQEWPTVRESIGKILMEGWRKREPNTCTETPWDVFKLSSLTIPNASIDDARWEASFATSREPHQLWSVQMQGRNPQQLTLDD